MRLFGMGVIRDLEHAILKSWFKRNGGPKKLRCNGLACDIDRIETAKPEFVKGFEYWNCWADDARRKLFNETIAVDYSAWFCPRTLYRGANASTIFGT